MIITYWRQKVKKCRNFWELWAEVAGKKNSCSPSSEMSWLCLCCVSIHPRKEELCLSSSVMYSIWVLLSVSINVNSNPRKVFSE